MAAKAPVAPAAAGAGAPAVAGGKQENVKVAIRVRPFNRREKDLGAKEIVEIGDEGKSIGITDPSKPADKPAEAKKTYFFDHVYGAETPQSDVYSQLARPIVDQALKGYNGTIFAYGQVRSLQ
jgi:kinesin family protein 3/17